jgi:hypothetical protein
MKTNPFILTHDLQNARISEVVIQSGGGFLGIGSKSYAVAPRVLTLDTPAKCLHINSPTLHCGKPTALIYFASSRIVNLSR